MDLFSFALLGIGPGAIYAVFAIGLILTYRASGIINFGYGAMILFGVFQFSELRSAGKLILPIGSIDLGSRPSVLVAFLIVLVHAAIFTIVIYALCFRPLHSAPPLARVVVSVGVMLALQALVIVRFGSMPRTIAPILPNEAVTVLGAKMPADRLYLAGIVIAIAIVLGLVINRTRFGMASRGAAENEKAAVLLGYRPSRLAAINWLIAGVGGTAIGILIAPTTSLEAGTYTMLIVPALGAALIGRLSSINWAVAGGLLLGIGQSAVMFVTQNVSWLPQAGLKQGLPFLVIIAVLIIQGNGLPGRGVADEKLPPAPAGPMRPALIIGVIAAVGVALPFLASQWRLGLITTMAAAVLCLSLVVLTGFVGQISLAQMSLAGVSGFTLAKIGAVGWIPFPVAMILAALVSTVLGVIVAIPALRVRGLHLAVVTLAAAVAIEELIFKNPKFTGGLSGASVAQPEIFGVNLGIRGAGEFPQVSFGYLVLAVVSIVAIGVALLRRSSLGRQMLAVRSSERAAAASGIDAARIKLIGATIASFLAGIGGALMAYQQGQLSFETFSVMSSLMLIAVVYIGGISSVTGGLVAALIFSGGLVSIALDEWLGLGEYETLILAIGLVAGAVMNPEGIAGMAHRLKLHRRAGAKRDPEDPAAQPITQTPVPVNAMEA